MFWAWSWRTNRGPKVSQMVAVFRARGTPKTTGTGGLAAAEVPARACTKLLVLRRKQ